MSKNGIHACKNVEETCWKQGDMIHTAQGRRREFKSGPAEEIFECRRHKRGRAERGLPLSLGGLPRENFEFLALLCAF